jgi:hypothetical protein
MQNISPVKQRILQYVEYLNISKRDFYSKTNISRGTLESNTGITEDTLAKFIAIYQNVSIEWLLTGKGNMIANQISIVQEQEIMYENNTEKKDLMRETIDAQKKLIDFLQMRIKELEENQDANNAEVVDAK